ncbi:MAG: hypothetical protein ACLVJH_11825, partial [Faecalibacterium prausnitzii]
KVKRTTTNGIGSTLRKPAGRCRSGISDFVLLKSSLPFLFLVVRPSERGLYPILKSSCENVFGAARSTTNTKLKIIFF